MSTLRLRFFLRTGSAGAPFASTEPPCLAQPIDLTETDRHLHLIFRDGLENHAAWTVGIVAEELPKKGFVSFSHLAAGTKELRRVINWDHLHVSILLKD